MPRAVRPAIGLWARRLAMVLAVAILPAAAAAGGYDRIGEASWYGGHYHGRTTASGETFDRNALTAAHRHLPFGTRVRVTNLANRRSVVVRINDRGPHARGRIIDLSQHAAALLGFAHSGVARVRVQTVAAARPARNERSRYEAPPVRRTRDAASLESIRESLRIDRYTQPVTLRPPGGIGR